MADRHQVGRGLLASGSRALRQRRPARSGEAFQAALTVFGGPDLAIGRGHALRGMGEAAAAQGDGERARRLLAHARREYQQLRELLGELAIDDELRELSRVRSLEAEALTLVIEANVALLQGDVATAHERVNAAYPIFKDAGDPASAANLWDATARIASWEGRHEAAMRAWRKALKLLVDQKDPRARCVTSLRLVEAYLATSRLDAAREVLEDADQLARDFDEPALTGRVYLAWGTWHARHDAFEAALDAYEDAMAAFQEAGDADEVLNTRIRAARAASRSGRMEVVGRLRAAIEPLEGGAHPTALGLCLAVMAEHALSTERADVALVAVESARRFWGDREPVDGQGPLLRAAVRALAELGDLRAALTVVHHLALQAGEGQPAAQALREGWRRRAPSEWVAQVDDLAPETLQAQAVAVIEQDVVRWAGKLGLGVEELGTVRGALTLCDQLGRRAAVVAVDEEVEGATRPVLLWEAGASERQQTALPMGITTVGRALDNDLPLPWDGDVQPVHCCFHRDRDGVSVLAVEGGPPVLVDGLEVQVERALCGGERVQVGSSVLRLQDRSGPLGAVAAAAPAVAVARP